MSLKTEQLRERLVDLEQSRDEERKRRIQTEILLSGLLPLGQATRKDEVLARLVDVLRQLLDFDHALLLVEEKDQQLVCVGATDSRLMKEPWSLATPLSRALGGEPVSVFDVRLVPQWRESFLSMENEICSALLIPLATYLSRAVLICTHRERGAFSQQDMALAQRVGPLAGQALRNIEQLRLERLQAQREREQSTGFRLLLEHSPDAIWVSRQGEVSYANPSLSKILEYDEAELVGTRVSSFVHVDDRSAYAQFFESLSGIGDSTTPHQVRLVKKSGEVVVLELVGLFLRIEEKPALICLGRDVTVRNELTARLMQMDRMIAAGTLAAGVGHEINNPLAFMSANVDFAARSIEDIRRFLTQPTASQTTLAEQLELLDELVDALDAARDGGERIANIVAELRNFSGKPAETEARPVEIAPVLASARKMVWNQLRHHACYREELALVPKVIATPAHLAQVFLNLLQNAAQAIEMGAAEENEILVRSRQQGDFVVVEISDTGAGIQPEHQAHIFDPFFTTKPPDQGTGLGLAISQQNLAALGGRIEFESTPGEGTTFRVFLPVADDTAPTVEFSMAMFEEDEFLEERLRVLVIDDEEKAGRAIERLLRQHADVVTTTSAKDALEQIASGEDYDAVLCDLLMPQISGMEFFRRLQHLAPELSQRVVFITGGVIMEETQQFLDSTQNPKLYKPFTRQALLDELGRITSMVGA